MNDYMTDSVPVREKPFFLFILKSLENGTKNMRTTSETNMSKVNIDFIEVLLISIC